MQDMEFIVSIDEPRVVAAIRAAEARTSGEIRVYISPDEVDDPILAAEEAFLRMGMQNTRNRNGVLIFLAPPSRNYAIVGDEAANARCGVAAWRSIVAQMHTSLQSEHPTEAIVDAVRQVGEILSGHFQWQEGDRNELPDRIERG